VERRKTIRRRDREGWSHYKRNYVARATYVVTRPKGRDPHLLSHTGEAENPSPRAQARQRAATGGPRQHNSVPSGPSPVPSG
jgi:hypothetical protein